jgi:hypothetical protein
MLQVVASILAALSVTSTPPRCFICIARSLRMVPESLMDPAALVADV